MATTIDDVARAAGVGRTTVFRALRNKDRISPETRAKILKVAEDLKYRPNFVASTLATGKSNVVAIVSTPSVVPVFEPIIKPIEHDLREAGYSMLFYASWGKAEDERLYLEQLMHSRVAGVIVHPSSNPADPGIYQEMVEEGVKLVIIDRYIEGLKAPQIVSNDYQAGRLAAEHLISLGHRRIVYLAIPRTSYVGRERARGFEDAMQSAGIPVPQDAVVETQLGVDDGAEAMAKILKRGDRPTAVIARQDVVAIGAMRAIAAAGLSVPEDISVIGNGDFWCDDMLRVPLTTVHYPLARMASAGVKRLLDMLAGQDVDDTTEVMDVKLIQRSSCAPVKLPDY